MNIFYLHQSPDLAAIYQCDKHIVKMPLESAQMCCAVAHRHNLTHLVRNCYKLTHANHPSTRWAGDNSANFRWLLTHAIHLCMEYKRRYHRTHKSSFIIAQMPAVMRELPDGVFTPPPQCMPERYHQPDTVEAYREYYFFEKSRIADYNHSETPDFMDPVYHAESYDGGQRYELPSVPARELPGRVYSVEHDLRVDINATDLRAELLGHGVNPDQFQ